MVGDYKGKEICGKGFTLIEVVVVIGILAVLAGVTVAAFVGYVEKREKYVRWFIWNWIGCMMYRTRIEEGKL